MLMSHPALTARPLQKQTYCPRDAGPHNICRLSTLGGASPLEIVSHRGRDRNLYQAVRYDSFSLVVGEWRSSAEYVDYTSLEGHIKINFWLSGRHTTVLDGFGQ